MSLNRRRIVLLICFLWGTAMLFIPLRSDRITGYYHGDSPEMRSLDTVHETITGSIAIGFNGHPAGIGGLVFFVYMPFLLVWQSFNIRRPFPIGQRAFLQLQALFLFLGAPYCYYISTFDYGVFMNAEHTTVMAIGGWMLFFQNILAGVFVFSAIAMPNGITGRFFDEKKS